MKITNKLNLPPAIYNAVCNDTYDGNIENTYSATTLIKDPCEIILTNRHAAEIEEDASESLYALLGSALHEVLDRAKEDENEIREERLFYEFPEGAISGKFDSFDATPGKEVLRDYK